MKKEIYLDDQGSKFGSLIAEQKPVNLSDLGPYSLIQVGRTLFMSTVSRPTRICCKVFKPSNMSYGVPYYENSKAFPSIYK